MAFKVNMSRKDATIIILCSFSNLFAGILARLIITVSYEFKRRHLHFTPGFVSRNGIPGTSYDANKFSCYFFAI
jgi:hypothetical protein